MRVLSRLRASRLCREGERYIARGLVVVGHFSRAPIGYAALREKKWKPRWPGPKLL